MRLLALSILLMLSGCAQVHEGTAAVKCVDRPVNQLLPGEVQLNSITAIDITSREIPLIASPHRVVVICGDEEGPATWGMETPAEGGLSEFSDPVKAAFEHFSFVY